MLITCQAKVPNPDLVTDLRWRGQDNITIMPKQLVDSLTFSNKQENHFLCLKMMTKLEKHIKFCLVLFQRKRPQLFYMTTAILFFS